MDPDDGYVLGRSDTETRRLVIQHQIYEPITRAFPAARIGTGMKLLDVGSGAGDVALLPADLAGPKGRDLRVPAAWTYGRYREWLPFHHRRRTFIDRVTVTLGCPEATAAEPIT